MDIIRKLILLSVLCTVLSSCGVRGALYLPKEKNAVENTQNNTSN